MNEMSNQNIENNGVNGSGTEGEGASPGRCFSAQQREPGRHHATARMKWSKEISKVIMECFYRSNPFDENGKPIRGYRQRLEKGKSEECLKQQNTEYVVKQGR